MTERKKKKRDQVKRPETIREALGDMEKVFKFLEKEGLDLYGLLTVDLIIDAAERLRKAMKDSGAPGVSWAEPFLQIDYDIEPEELSAGEWLFQSGEDSDSLIDRIPEEEQRAYFENMTDAEFQAWLAQGSTRTMMISLFRVRTEDAVFIVNEDGEGPATGWRLPAELNAELDSMTEDEERAKMEEIAAGFVFRQEFPGMKTGPEGEEEAWNIALTYAIRPLTAIWEERAFFAVQVGLEYIEGDPSGWTAEEQAELWEHIAGWLDSLRKEIKQGGRDIPPVETPDQTQAIARTDYFKAPGRLFDTARHAAEHGLFEDIEKWHSQPPFNQTVSKAAAALTKTNTREDNIMGWQSATVEEIADLVYCRSEGVPAHGQQRQDILKAFEAIRAAPVPLVKIEWRRIGTARHPRFVKEYGLRVASLFQSYGAIYEEKSSGKEVAIDDPALRNDRIERKPDRRKSVDMIVSNSSARGILETLPPDRYKLKRLEWRWNTDIAEDFICPLTAVDDRGRERRKPIKGFHIEGKRFINIHREYFAVQKELRRSGHRYAPALLDYITSEKAHIKSKASGAVWIEVGADKVIKYLGLWRQYERRPQRVLEERIAPAVTILMGCNVLLPGSWTVPRRDSNEERRKTEYFRWKVAEKFTTVALVSEAEAERIEAEFTEEEPPEQTKPEAVQGALPFGDEDENEAVELPTGAEIRAARTAAGVTLREFARMMDGPNKSTWSTYERGETIRVGNISPGTWEKVREFIAENVPEEPE